MIVIQWLIQLIRLISNNILEIWFLRSKHLEELMMNKWEKHISSKLKEHSLKEPLKKERE